MGKHDCDYCDCAQYSETVYKALHQAAYLNGLTIHTDKSGNDYVLVSAFRDQMVQLMERVNHNGF